MRRREVLVGAPGSEKKKTIKMRGKEKLKVRKKKGKECNVNVLMKLDLPHPFVAVSCQLML